MRTNVHGGAGVGGAGVGAGVGTGVALAPAWGQHRRRRSDAAETSHDSHPIMRRESPQREARRTHTGSDEVTHTLRGGRDATAATCSCDNLDAVLVRSSSARAGFLLSLLHGSTGMQSLAIYLLPVKRFMGKTFYDMGLSVALSYGDAFSFFIHSSTLQ